MPLLGWTPCGIMEMHCFRTWVRFQVQSIGSYVMTFNSWQVLWALCKIGIKICNLKSCWNNRLFGTTDWFQIGNGLCQGSILSPFLFNLYAEYIMRNSWLDEAQAGIKISGRNINNLRYADDTTLMAESEEVLKSPWWKWKRRVKKLDLSLTFRKQRSWYPVSSLHSK